MISDTIVFDIFSLLYGILIKNSYGIEILHDFFIAQPSVISYVSLCKIIFITGGSYFKIHHTVNVAFIVSELTEEQFLYMTSSKNDSLK